MLLLLLLLVVIKMLRNHRSNYYRMKLREWRGPEQKGLVHLRQRCCLVTIWDLRRWTQTSKRGASANWYWHVSEVWFWQVRKLQPEINLNELFERVWMNYCSKELPLPRWKPLMWWYWQAQVVSSSSLSPVTLFHLNP